MALALLLAFNASAGAQAPRAVEDRSDFLALVDGANLRTLGMTLQIRPDGRITGTAFGTTVHGRWEWSEAYFCRSLSWGGRHVPRDCQSITLISRTLRMTEKRGEGSFVDFWLN